VKKPTPFNRLLSIIMLLGILAVPTLLCGFTVSFKAAFQMWAFLLAFLVPSIGGSLLVKKYFWKNERLSFFLIAGVIGATFFITSVVGMTMDERISSWNQVFSFSAFTGVIGFVAVIVITPLYSFLVRNVFKTR
jgi:hypothetical protein